MHKIKCKDSKNKKKSHCIRIIEILSKFHVHAFTEYVREKNRILKLYSKGVLGCVEARPVPLREVKSGGGEEAHTGVREGRHTSYALLINTNQF